MDFASKLVGLFTFLLPLAVLHSLESDVSVIEADEQIILNAVESILLSEDTKQNLYFDDMDYSPEIGAQNVGRKFNIHFDQSANATSNLSQFEYFIIAPKKKNKNTVYLHYDKCKKEEANVIWGNETVSKIQYKAKTYLIGYNEAGLVRTLTEDGSKNKSAKRHQFEYTEDGKIKSIITKDILKNSKILNSKISYSYTENKIEIVNQSYNQPTSTKGQKIKYTDYTTFVLDDISLTRISYKRDDKSTIAETNETILNRDGQVMRRVRTIPGKGDTHIDSYEYNESGQLLKAASIIASTDSIISHKESLYSYNHDESNKNSNCDQQVSMIHSQYDENGKLYHKTSETIF